MEMLVSVYIVSRGCGTFMFHLDFFFFFLRIKVFKLSYFFCLLNQINRFCFSVSNKITFKTLTQNPAQPIIHTKT